MRRLLVVLMVLGMGLSLMGQKKGKAAQLEYRFDPPFWWTGMAYSRVELLLRQPSGANAVARLSYPGVKIVEQGQAENPRYRYIILDIDATAQPGVLNFQMGEGPQSYALPYTLKAREKRAGFPGGLTTADFIYLAMPDRFSNGDPSNDVIKGMNEVRLSRDSMFWRHGGDLRGVMNHLDYIDDLGVTALWLNPVLENNQPEASYHGYAATDVYKVDPRFGTNEEFKALTEACHRRGMKMVMDVVYNHWGDHHHLYLDLPWASWIHRFPEGYVKTSYRAPALMDPYASEADRKIMSDGWFDRRMPDLNQKDPHLAEYLIQNSIWWIEYAGLDGFRIDTYAYPDLVFMGKLLRRIFMEYQTFGVFGETWVDGAPVQVYFHENKIEQDIQSALPGVTDFQLYFAMNEALNKEQGWTEGASRLYLALGADYVHANPMRNVVFLDNHDVSRFYSVVGEDYRKFKMGIAWLLTVRGIPQMYYGTEILMKNFANPDGKVRDDFPGGWAGDKANKFVAEGRTKAEQDAYQYVRTLAKWRKTSNAVQTGRTTQFVPENGVYVYFRRGMGTTVMVMLNFSGKGNVVDMGRFKECYGTAVRGVDVVTKEGLDLKGKVDMEPWSVWILELE